MRLNCREVGGPKPVLNYLTMKRRIALKIPALLLVGIAVVLAIVGNIASSIIILGIAVVAHIFSTIMY